MQRACLIEAATVRKPALYQQRQQDIQSYLAYIQYLLPQSRIPMTLFDDSRGLQAVMDAAAREVRAAFKEAKAGYKQAVQGIEDCLAQGLCASWGPLSAWTMVPWMRPSLMDRIAHIKEKHCWTLHVHPCTEASSRCSNAAFRAAEVSCMLSICLRLRVLTRLHPSIAPKPYCVMRLQVLSTASAVTVSVPCHLLSSHRDCHKAPVTMATCLSSHPEVSGPEYAATSLTAGVNLFAGMQCSGQC